VAGWCHRCGSPYVAEDYTNRARYCSDRCSRATIKDRYRARKRSAYVADVWRIRIFERDGWRCRICSKPVERDAAVPHPRAPVVDHVISLANGGTHEPANAQCAHFLCNSIKRDLDPTVQLMLFG
jgi:5-methylcytosine-specific restriction endonuclease McrA